MIRTAHGCVAAVNHRRWPAHPVPALLPIRTSCPAHADGKELFHALGGEGRGPRALVADPCSALELSFLLVPAALAVLTVVFGGDGDSFDASPGYAEVSFVRSLGFVAVG